MVLKEPNLN